MWSWTRCDRVALVRGRRLLGASLYARSGGSDCPQALEGFRGCAELPRRLDGCIRLLSAKRVFARGAASEGPKICPRRSLTAPIDTPRLWLGWLARGASHGSIKPLLVSLFCGDAVFSTGLRAAAGLRAEPSETPRTASRTFQIQNPICGHLRLGQAGRIAVRARHARA